MRALRARLTYANVMATLAMFFVLGGGAYAAGTKLAKNSVGSRELKTNAVTSSKVKDGKLLAKDFKAGQLPAGRTGATGAQGAKGDKGDKGDPGPLPDTLPSGKTLRGAWGGGVTVTAGGQVFETSISFAFPLASAPTIHVIQAGAVPPSDCPGTVAAPEARPGHLCVYVRFANNGTTVSSYGPDDQTNPRFGLVLLKASANASGSNNEMAGTYAVTAP
jgi:hypothetical protein